MTQRFSVVENFNTLFFIKREASVFSNNRGIMWSLAYYFLFVPKKRLEIIVKIIKTFMRQIRSPTSVIRENVIETITKVALDK